MIPLVGYSQARLMSENITKDILIARETWLKQ